MTDYDKLRKKARGEEVEDDEQEEQKYEVDFTAKGSIEGFGKDGDLRVELVDSVKDMFVKGVDDDLEKQPNPGDIVKVGVTKELDYCYLGIVQKILQPHEQEKWEELIDIAELAGLDESGLNLSKESDKPASFHHDGIKELKRSIIGMKRKLAYLEKNQRGGN